MTHQAVHTGFILRNPFRIALLIALLSTTFLAITPWDYEIVDASFSDKIEHLLAFLTLAFLTDFAFSEQPWNRYKFLSLLGYGLILEIIQYYLPLRHFSFWDLAADALGLLIYPLFLPLLKQVSWLSRRWSG